MGQDNAELIAEARSVLADMETRQEYDDCFARVVDALERVTPREVTTVAELNALPDGAVIRWDSGVDFVTAERYYRLWMPAGTDGTLDSADITLPATVLFTPTGKETE
jgi:hypothetical protein